MLLNLDELKLDLAVIVGQLKTYINTTKTILYQQRSFFYVLLVISIFTTGCAAKKIILHPIEETDIAQLDQGESIRAPKRGFFISDYYMEEVMKAKVE